MLHNCFSLPMLPTNAYFHSVCLVSMSLCYNICLEKETQLLLGQSYMFGNDSDNDKLYSGNIGRWPDITNKNT